MKILEILKQSEDKSLEFKKEIPKNRENLLKTVVAFANGSGGQKSEVRGQRSEVGKRQRAEVRDQKTEDVTGGKVVFFCRYGSDILEEKCYTMK
jgi:hypothetical protein